MELADHLRKISFIFFILLGIIHFIAGFLFVNGYFANETAVINRALFIPFAVSALAYIFADAIFHQISSGKSARTLTYILIFIWILALGGLISAEILIPDSASILLPFPKYNL